MDSNTLRIFSFAGGSTKGYGENRFMQKFIHQWGIPQADLWKYVDAFAGVSTGAILASSYSVGKTMNEVEPFYLEKAKRIFTIRTAAEVASGSHNANTDSNRPNTAQKIALIGLNDAFYASPYEDSNYGSNILHQTLIENFGVNTTPKSSDISKSKQEDAVIYSGISKKIEDADDGNAYFNGFNDAQAAMTNATTDASQAMRKTQAYLEAPARFKQSVRSRVNMLTSAFDNLQNTVVGTNKKISKNTKLFYEAKAGNVVSAIALATSIIFDEDYTNRFEVVEQVEKLLFTFSTYLQTLDDLQTGSGGDKNDFIPAAQGIIQLNNLVTFSAANLFKIGLSAKQERFYFVPDDTDLISLAHQLYGLENGDASIDELIKNNGFGMDAYLLIKKGTLVKYYI